VTLDKPFILAGGRVKSFLWVWVALKGYDSLIKQHKEPGVHSKGPSELHSAKLRREFSGRKEDMLSRDKMVQLQMSQSLSSSALNDMRSGSTASFRAPSGLSSSVYQGRARCSANERQENPSSGQMLSLLIASDLRQVSQHFFEIGS
jgi:hypothetical protein